MASRRSPAVLAALRDRAGRTVAAVTAFAFVLTGAGGLFVAPAQAADLPKVLVLPYAPVYDSLPRASGEKTAEMLQNELKSSEQLQLVTIKAEATPVVARSASPTPRRDQGLLAEAREHANKGDDLIKKLKFKPAVDELEKAISLFEGQHPYIEFGDLVNAYLSLAVAYFRLSQDSEGEKLLAQVVRLDPERKLDAERFPPVFLRIYENIGNKIRGAPRGSLQINPSSSGASVFVDGREMGKAPVLINDIIKGNHFIKVVPSGGGDPWADRIEIRPNATATISPDLGGGGGPLGELLGSLMRNNLDEVAVAKALGLADSAKADYVVLGGVHKEGEQIVVSSHLIAVATKKMCLLQRVVFDQEMLGAGIEVYKIGADIANRVEVFGDEEKLPAKVARDALPKAGGSMATVSAGEGRGPDLSTGRRPAGSGGRGPVGPVVSTSDRGPRQPVDSGPEVKPLIRSSPSTDTKPVVVASTTPEDAPRALDTTPRTEVRNITAQPADLVGTEPVGPNDGPAVTKKSSNTVLWIAIGVVAAGGLITGGVVVARNLTAAPTGTATISW